MKSLKEVFGSRFISQSHCVRCARSLVSIREIRERELQATKSWMSVAAEALRSFAETSCATFIASKRFPISGTYISSDTDMYLIVIGDSDRWTVEKWIGANL